MGNRRILRRKEMKHKTRFKRFAVEALMGFILWTLLLTPYMLWVTNLTWDQYCSWLVMQAVIIPWMSVIVITITNKVVKLVMHT